MPCFAHLDANPRANGRATWRRFHVLVGVMFLPFFVLVVSLTAYDSNVLSKADALTPPVVIFWLALVGWFCFVPMNVGRNNSEDMAVSCTLYNAVAFMCAIVVTLFAYQEVGNSGKKMTPLFVLAGPWLFLSLILCLEDGGLAKCSLTSQVGCTGLVFIGGLVATLICTALKIDDNLQGTSWGEVFVGTWVSDPFVLGVIARMFKRYDARDANKFALLGIMCAIWTVWFLFRVLFVIRQDNIDEYYSLGSRAFVRRTTDSGSIPLLACTLPLLFFGVYMLCGGFHRPLQVTFDAHWRASQRRALARKKARDDERQAMDDARRVARGVFQRGRSGSSKEAKDIESSGGMEMVSQLDESDAGAGSTAAGGEEAGHSSGKSSGSGGRTSKDVKVALEASSKSGTDAQEWSAALKVLEEASSEVDMLDSIGNIVRLLDIYPDLRRMDERMELITVAKRKQATHKDAWTQQVALAFRGALSRFSVLAAPIASLRQFSATLNPFRLGSRKSEESAHEGNDDLTF